VNRQGGGAHLDQVSSLQADRTHTVFELQPDSQLVSDGRTHSAPQGSSRTGATQRLVLNREVHEPRIPEDVFTAAVRLESAMDTRNRNIQAVVKSRMNLLDLIVPANPKGRISETILAVIDADDLNPMQNTKQLYDAIQADREAQRDAAAVAAAAPATGTRRSRVVDLYAPGGKFHRIARIHDSLKPLLDAPAKTNAALEACEGAIKPINLRATDRVIPAIDKYRAAKTASPSNPEAISISEARNELVEAIKGADNSRLPPSTLVSLFFAQFTRFEAEATAAGVANIAKLSSDLDAKKSTLDAAKAKVTAKDKEIDTQRGVCKKAEEVVGKLINPE
jgi:hypothetical protein